MKLQRFCEEKTADSDIAAQIFHVVFITVPIIVVVAAALVAVRRSIIVWLLSHPRTDLQQGRHVELSYLSPSIDY